MTVRECRPPHRSLALLVLLPALACSGGGGGPVVGDVRLGAVTLPTQGQAGHPVSLTAEVFSDTHKYNVTVRLSLVRTSDPASVDPLSPGFRPDVQVWGTVIDELVAGASTTLVESFDLPPDLLATTYAAVLELNAVDFTSEDDALQGEEAAQRANNARVGPAALVVTTPALVDVDVTNVTLDRGGFDLQDLHPPASFGAEEELFGAAVTVVARTHSARDAVAFGFELGVPDPDGVTSWHPLDVGAAGPGGEYAGPLTRYVLEPEAQLDAEDVSTFVALLANRPRSFHVGLHAPAATHDALSAHGSTVDCQVRAFVVPGSHPADHDPTNDERQVPITFAPAGYDHGSEGGLALSSPGESATLTPGAPAANKLKTWHRSQTFGKGAFTAGYYLDATVSTSTADAQRARDLRLTSNATASVTVLGSEPWTAVAVRTIGNLDLDSDTRNAVGASVEAFSVRILDVSQPFAREQGEVVLYERRQELYSTSKTRKKTYLLGGVVPMTVTGTARVELGLLGRISAGPDRRLTFGVGPWVNATGTTDATVHLVVASGGVTGDIRFLYLDQIYDNAIVLADDLSKQYQFNETFHLKTLDGDVYLHAKTVAGCGFLGLSSCHYKRGLIDWSGYSKTFTVPIATYQIAPPP